MDNQGKLKRLFREVDRYIYSPEYRISVHKDFLAFVSGPPSVKRSRVLLPLRIYVCPPYLPSLKVAELGGWENAIPVECPVCKKWANHPVVTKMYLNGDTLFGGPEILFSKKFSQHEEDIVAAQQELDRIVALNRHRISCMSNALGLSIPIISLFTVEAKCHRCGLYVLVKVYLSGIEVEKIKELFRGRGIWPRAYTPNKRYHEAERVKDMIRECLSAVEKEDKKPKALSRV